MFVFNKGKINEIYIHHECEQIEGKDSITQGKCPGQLCAG